VETCDFRVSCLPGNPEAPGGEGKPAFGCLISK